MKVKVIVLLMVFLSVFLVGNVSANNSVVCYIYDVEITGTASDNPFDLYGQFAIIPSTITDVTDNDVNPFEVWLVSGNPAISPETGSIIFTSNTVFSGGGKGPGSTSMVDMVNFATNSDNSQFWVQPDPNIAKVGVNYFNTSSGLTGSIYTIYDSILDRNDNPIGLSFYFNEDFSEVNGYISVYGTGAYYYFNIPYVANFSGSYSYTTDGQDCAFSNV